MFMQDNVCNNFVLPALHSEVSPLVCLLCPSWWPCLDGLVRQVEWVHPHPQLAQKPPKFLVHLLTIVAMLGEVEPQANWGEVRLCMAPSFRNGKVGQSLCSKHRRDTMVKSHRSCHSIE